MFLNYLEEIRKSLHHEVDYINKVINHLDGFEKATSVLFDEYVICHSKPAKTDPNGYKLRGRHGVYIFVLKEDVIFTDVMLNEYQKIKGAKLKKEQVYIDKKGSTEYYKDMCLYLGSSISRSLYSRLRDHFGNDTKKSALHLGAAERAMFLNSVIAYAFPIKKEYANYYKIIVPELETQMHHDFYPFAGSPRT